jgi:hypothetical protein
MYYQHAVQCGNLVDFLSFEISRRDFECVVQTLYETGPVYSFYYIAHFFYYCSTLKLFVSLSLSVTLSAFLSVSVPVQVSVSVCVPVPFRVTKTHKRLNI